MPQLIGEYDPSAIKMSALTGIGTKPTAVLTAAAGTGATVSVDGTNLCGIISVTSGTGVGLVGGKILDLTLADGLTYPTKMSITFSAANNNFATLIAMLFVTCTQNVASLSVSNALTAGLTYTGYYHVMGY